MVEVGNEFVKFKELALEASAFVEDEENEIEERK